MEKHIRLTRNSRYDSWRVIGVPNTSMCSSEMNWWFADVDNATKITVVITTRKPAGDWHIMTRLRETINGIYHEAKMPWNKRWDSTSLMTGATAYAMKFMKMEKPYYTYIYVDKERRQ
jgi:hypothetical protein